MFRDMELERPRKIDQRNRAQISDLRQMLHLEFERRVAKNPSYSLRAFAKALGIYHATLSALMSGARPFTVKSARSISVALGLSPTAVANHANETPAAKRKAALLIDPVADDEYSLEANWRHDALLECLQLPKQSHETRSLAASLGFTAAEVMSSLQLLERRRMIQRATDGSWRPLVRNTSNILGHLETSAARRRYQKELLEKSQTALEEIAIEKRDHTSITMTIDEEDMPELKEIIRDYRRKVMAFAQRKGAKPNHVYQLQISLFPLTKEPSK